MYKSLVIVILSVISIAIVGNALKCYECSGSMMSDCAKGVKGAGVEVKCEAPNYDEVAVNSGVSVEKTTVASSQESTEVTTEESHYDKMKRLGCFQPVPLYPACVTYSMKPYNGLDGQMMVYRSCMLSPDDFCKSHLQYNKESACHSCNSTDFCM